jgi:hypothetical protein
MVMEEFTETKEIAAQNRVIKTTKSRLKRSLANGKNSLSFLNEAGSPTGVSEGSRH